MVNSLLDMPVVDVIDIYLGPYLPQIQQGIARVRSAGYVPIEIHLSDSLGLLDGIKVFGLPVITEDWPYMQVGVAGRNS